MQHIHTVWTSLTECLQLSFSFLPWHQSHIWKISQLLQSLLHFQWQWAASCGVRHMSHKVADQFGWNCREMENKIRKKKAKISSWLKMPIQCNWYCNHEILWTTGLKGTDCHQFFFFHLPSVCSRQLLWCPPFLYSEELGSIAAIQLYKAIHGHAWCTRHKLKQAWSGFIVEGKHSLQETKRNKQNHYLVPVVSKFQESYRSDAGLYIIMLSFSVIPEALQPRNAAKLSPACAVLSY